MWTRVPYPPAIGGTVKVTWLLRKTPGTMNVVGAGTVVYAWMMIVGLPPLGGPLKRTTGAGASIGDCDGKATLALAKPLPMIAFGQALRALAVSVLLSLAGWQTGSPLASTLTCLSNEMVALWSGGGGFASEEAMSRSNRATTGVKPCFDSFVGLIEAVKVWVGAAATATPAVTAIPSRASGRIVPLSPRPRFCLIPFSSLSH